MRLQKDSVKLLLKDNSFFKFFVWPCLNYFLTSYKHKGELFSK